METLGLRWWQDRIRIVSITTEAENTYVVDAFKLDITPLFPALKGTKIVAHNALFDLLFLKRAGFEPGECACNLIGQVGPLEEVLELSGNHAIDILFGFFELNQDVLAQQMQQRILGYLHFREQLSHGLGG